MGAISNDNLTNYRNHDLDDFEPAVAYTFDGTAKEVDFVDSTAWQSGVALKVGKCSAFDHNGKEVRGAFGPATGSDSGSQSETTLDVSSLDLSKPLDLFVTLVGDDDMTVADGGAYKIGAAGEIGSWDKQKNALTNNP